VPRRREEIPIIDSAILNLAVALGIGLLIGAERERRKGEGPSRAPAGIRTFTVASLAGAISFIAGGEVLLAVATAGVILLTAIAYWRAHEDDPGLTTEIALILTVLLGGLYMQQPALAAGLAVTVAVLLAARDEANGAGKRGNCERADTRGRSRWPLALSALTFGADQQADPKRHRKVQDRGIDDGDVLHVSCHRVSGSRRRRPRYFRTGSKRTYRFCDGRPQIPAMMFLNARTQRAGLTETT
jgi:hypothetical protein